MSEAGDVRPSEDASGSGFFEAERDAVSADGRNETAAEKADRNWEDILQELRAVQTGTQILTGFLLAVAFQPVFQDLGRYEVTFYLILVVLAGSATVLGLSPIIMHRQAFGRRRKPQLVRAANRVLIGMLVVVSLLVAGVVSFLFTVAVSGFMGFVALCVAGAVLLVFWTLVPWLSRAAR